jgi:formylglycine-generating enzyme required for sulfatase activity
VTLRAVLLAGGLLLAVAAVRGPGLLAEEPPGAPALRALDAAALVARWRAAPRGRRQAIEVEIRRRGPACAAALRAIGADAPPRDRAGAGRMLARLRVDWHRAHVPAGMAYVPEGPLEIPRAEKPWGPSGERRAVGAFYIDRTEVTVGAWRAWMAGVEASWTGTAEALADLERPLAAKDDSLPAVEMTWQEARRYAREARGGRLPEADEFERALRGSGLSTYPWGAVARAGYANLRHLGPDTLLPVGSLPRGRSTFGVLDLVGNAAEWTATVVPYGRSGRVPLVLGGSFRDAADPAHTWRGRARTKAALGASERRDWVGFRVVRDVPSLP